MFAIVRTGGKQYKVEKGDIVVVEKLESSIGDLISFDKVLMVGDNTQTRVGSPLLEKAKVFVEVINQEKADKVIIFKKRRRHTYRRKKGHRQNHTVVKVLEISLDGVQSVKSSAQGKDKEKPAAEKKIVEKVVEKKVAAPKAKKADPKAEKPVKKTATKKVKE